MCWENQPSEPMDILFEDKHLLVVNKPAGVLSEGSEESLSVQLSDQRNEALSPCHRLDRDTSGLIVLARNKPALTRISSQFASRTVRKAYLACVEGEWLPSWNRVETRIRRLPDGRMANDGKGKPARSTFRRLACWDGRSLLEVLPKTGRTHQIRLHCLHQGCPIAGDGLYGTADPGGTPMALHARELRFRHPASGEPLTLTAPPPDYWPAYWLLGCPVEIG